MSSVRKEAYKPAPLVGLLIYVYGRMDRNKDLVVPAIMDHSWALISTLTLAVISALESYRGSRAVEDRNRSLHGWHVRHALDWKLFRS